ncbi:MAG: hypothetical protein WC651_01035 [Candidatus Gracilibacteria bacterium]|jgi:hypothetical protein
MVQFKCLDHYPDHDLTAKKEGNAVKVKMDGRTTSLDIHTTTVIPASTALGAADRFGTHEHCIDSARDEVNAEIAIAIAAD